MPQDYYICKCKIFPATFVRVSYSMIISMRLKFLILCSLLISTLQAQNTPGIPLGTTEATFFKAPDSVATGKTIVMLPGGGYTHHAMNHEGYDWVPFFNGQGVNVVVLKYTLPDGDRNKPLNDVKKTFQTLKQHSDEWNVDKNNIGIMGFSAGGHLASTYSTHVTDDDAPAFQILFYPVISFTPSLTHPGSRDSFLGKNQSEELIKEFSNEYQVTGKTPKAIIFHSDNDGLVVPQNSINYYEALRQNGIPASLNIYPVGEHGWGFRETFPYHEAMLQVLAEWLKD